MSLFLSPTSNQPPVTHPTTTQAWVWLKYKSSNCEKIHRRKMEGDMAKMSPGGILFFSILHYKPQILKKKSIILGQTQYKNFWFEASRMQNHAKRCFCSVTLYPHGLYFFQQQNTKYQDCGRKNEYEDRKFSQHHSWFVGFQTTCLCKLIQICKWKFHEWL